MVLLFLFWGIGNGWLCGLDSGLSISLGEVRGCYLWWIVVVLSSRVELLCLCFGCGGLWVWIFVIAFLRCYKVLICSSF